MFQIMIYMYMLFIILLKLLVLLLISVAFLTLMERKVLGFMQSRVGPNKVGFMGIIQPFSDFIKLLSKEFYFMKNSNYLMFYFSPVYMLVLIMMMWIIYPFFFNGLMMDLGFIYLMCCFSLGGYGLLISGWSSNSLYSMLGSIRSLAQSISYEVTLSLIMMSLMMLIESLDFKDFKFFEGWYWYIYLMPVSTVFLFSLMAELNRTPFDFSEGESELVSGFNVEYMSTNFILVFLSEYASILFLSYIYVLMFMGLNVMMFEFYLSILYMIFFILWIRGSMPRFRYDLLMYLCWLIILPFSLNYLMFIYMLKFFIYK